MLLLLRVPVQFPVRSRLQVDAIRFTWALGQNKLWCYTIINASARGASVNFEHVLPIGIAEEKLDWQCVE